MSEIQNLTKDYFIYEFDKSTNGINAKIVLYSILFKCKHIYSAVY